MLDYNNLLKEVKTWALEVGRLQVENLGKKDLQVTTKSSAIDLVTEIDRLSEDRLVEWITRRFPNHSILSEEAGQKDENSDYCWIIDPLDGTTNYAQGLPVFAVSIALVYQGETVLALVYAPLIRQMFWAVKGQGAYRDNQRLTVSAKTELQQSVLATGFPYDRAVHPENNVRYFSRLVPMVRGIRRMGSAAYDLANVAAGTLDGYWELNLSPWDVAAGALLVAEAGGKIIYLTEKRGISLIAGNETICGEIWREIKSAQ